MSTISVQSLRSVNRLSALQDCLFDDGEQEEEEGILPASGSYRWGAAQIHSKSESIFTVCVLCSNFRLDCAKKIDLCVVFTIQYRLKFIICLFLSFISPRRVYSELTTHNFTHADKRDVNGHG